MAASHVIIVFLCLLFHIGLGILIAIHMLCLTIIQHQSVRLFQETIN